MPHQPSDEGELEEQVAAADGAAPEPSTTP